MIKRSLRPSRGDSMPLSLRMLRSFLHREANVEIFSSLRRKIFAYAFSVAISSPLASFTLYV